MYSPRDNAALPALGFPIRESADHRLFSASPRLIAAVHALHRLLVPRHPPCALDILTVISMHLFAGHGKWAGRAVREHAISRWDGGPGDTRSCWQLCSLDRKSTRLNSSHANISYAVFCLKKKKK